jgi:hypothetical protein
MTDSMTRPVRGDQVRRFDNVSGQYYEVLGRVSALMSRGIHGWIVELETLLYVEVVPEPDSSVFREIMPSERRSRRT